MHQSNSAKAASLAGWVVEPTLGDADAIRVSFVPRRGCRITMVVIPTAC
jgi:hypothetical protein